MSVKSGVVRKKERHLSKTKTRTISLSLNKLKNKQKQKFLMMISKFFQMC